MKIKNKILKNKIKLKTSMKIKYNLNKKTFKMFNKMR